MEHVLRGAKAGASFISSSLVSEILIRSGGVRLISCEHWDRLHSTNVQVYLGDRGGRKGRNRGWGA